MARNLWAAPVERKFFMAFSRCLVGWWLFSARLFKYFELPCSTEHGPGVFRLGVICPVWLPVWGEMANERDF
ncbi:hypothetical protein ABIE67_009345 [Streptomyces sp. V4I8]